MLDFETELVDLLNLVDFVNFREAMAERSDDYDIAFIDGAISIESDITRIKAIRDQTKILVTIKADRESKSWERHRSRRGTQRYPVP